MNLMKWRVPYIVIAYNLDVHANKCLNMQLCLKRTRTYCARKRLILSSRTYTKRLDAVYDATDYYCNLYQRPLFIEFTSKRSF